MSGISQNTKNLTITQIQSLLANNGVLSGAAYARAVKANAPVEYCLESLKSSLNEKLEKRAAKYRQSSEAQTAEINSMINSANLTAFPPPMPENFKSKAIVNEAPYIKQTETINPVEKPSININVEKPVEKSPTEIQSIRDAEIQQAKINYGYMLARREVEASKILFRNSLILTAAGFFAAYLMIGA